MWRSKKFIMVAVLVAVLLFGSIGSIAVFAQTGSGSTDTGKTLLARVATILGIDQKKVEDAFAQAQREMQTEALSNYLKNLVDQGKITPQQADQYKQWFQSRPNVPALGPGFGPRGHGGFPGGFRGLPGPAKPPTSTAPAATP
ncbi:MAG: hypothetical protein Q8O16_02915 [Dehalococcoidia bacterium]|nr:hypothetical protein [Dehalococcoidia bacterium]